MKKWFWRNAQGRAVGPATENDLSAAAFRGEIGPSTPVSDDGVNWRPAGTIQGLVFGGVPVPRGEGETTAPRRTGLNGFAIAAIVVGALFLLSVPFFVWSAFQARREAVLRMQCVNQMKRIGLALQNYSDANEGALPPVYTVDEDGRPLHSWRVLLLPYFDDEAEAALCEQIRLDEPWDSEWNSQFHDRAPVGFTCPSARAAAGLEFDEPFGLTSYSVVVGDETAFPAAKERRIWEITDGTSNTLTVIERKTPVCWMDPTQELTFETFVDEFGSERSGGGNALMADGSVRFVSKTIDETTLRATATAAGGETDFF
ncbi:MAG: DUF1559 domain-containing protein [Thermoguttaceae bacterium]|nr:DUF1559 domain-containing protein [Thermoguttaceae bacterium]MBQ7110999.1 DUF1559 domain-containing protein [Thermoguttaceae bacterium]